LKFFKSKGFYLLDLFEKRGINIHNASEKEKERAKNKLRRLLPELRPKYIVITPIRISGFVMRIVRKLISDGSLQISTDNIAWLPFPTRHFWKYILNLVQLLNEMRDAKII